MQAERAISAYVRCIGMDFDRRYRLSREGPARVTLVTRGPLSGARMPKGSLNEGA